MARISLSISFSAELRFRSKELRGIRKDLVTQALTDPAQTTITDASGLTWHVTTTHSPQAQAGQIRVYLRNGADHTYIDGHTLRPETIYITGTMDKEQGLDIKLKATMGSTKEQEWQDRKLHETASDRGDRVNGFHQEVTYVGPYHKGTALWHPTLNYMADLYRQQQAIADEYAKPMPTLE